jgi:hypothetical protein
MQVVPHQSVRQGLDFLFLTSPSYFPPHMALNAKGAGG